MRPAASVPTDDETADTRSPGGQPDPTTDGVRPFRPDRLVIGVDVGGTKTFAVLYGPDGVLATHRTPSVPGGEGVVHAVAHVVEALSAQSGTPLENVDRIGIGIPGVVDPIRGCVASAVNLEIGEDPLPLARLVSASVGVDVHLENDVNAAAIGSAHATHTEGDDTALIAIGTGLAAGFVLSGRARAGFSGASGEIGHVPYVADGPLCRCGQRGCLELYASGSAIDRLWPTPPGIHSAVALFAAASSDSRAREVRDTWLTALAHCVQIVAQTVDPRWILIGGGIADVGDPLIDGLRRTLLLRGAASPFLQHQHLEERCLLVPDSADLTPRGACLAALGTPA